MDSSSSIRIAVWGRDRRIVAITSFLIVVDLFAACFGRRFLARRLHDRVSDILIPSDNKGDIFSRCLRMSGVLTLRVSQGHAQWSPLAQTCQVSNTNELKWPVMLSFLVDFLLLTIVLFGLLYKRLETHLWRMLFFQCLFWIVASLMTGVPDSVCRVALLISKFTGSTRLSDYR
jgi:hypothetical protein